jgi:hypothetical protein
MTMMRFRGLLKHPSAVVVHEGQHLVVGGLKLVLLAVQLLLVLVKQVMLLLLLLMLLLLLLMLLLLGCRRRGRNDTVLMPGFVKVVILLAMLWTQVATGSIYKKILYVIMPQD